MDRPDRVGRRGVPTPQHPGARDAVPSYSDTPTTVLSPEDSDVHLFPLADSEATRKRPPPKNARAVTPEPTEQPFLLTREYPRVHRSRLRSVFAKGLFFAIFSAVLILLACEISVALHLPWLDPRPVLVKVQRLVIEHLPARMRL